MGKQSARCITSKPLYPLSSKADLLATADFFRTLSKAFESVASQPQDAHASFFVSALDALAHNFEALPQFDTSPSQHSTAEPAVPSGGYLRLKQIIGDRKATPPIAPILPVSKSHFWSCVKRGIYPAGTKLSKRITVWRREDILALVAKSNEGAKV